MLEDVADNLFNPDPYYQQGGDMVRVGGLHYACEPNARDGRAHQRLALHGKPIEADKLQGRRLGAGVGRGEGGRRRTDLGRGGALSARRKRRSSRAPSTCRG